MHDETKSKEIFSAPWEVSNVTGNVINPEGDTICHAASTDLAQQIKHLPELYDELVCLVSWRCEDCFCEEHQSDTNFPYYDELIKCGCPMIKEKPKFRPWCHIRRLITLLQKVREAK